MPEKFQALLRQYHDGKISRRDFMRRAAVVTGELALAETLLARIVETDVYGGEVDESDPAISAESVQYPGKAGAVFGYLAQPSAPGKYPVIIVTHANQGLNDYTRDVARRLAKQNYAALAVDFLSRTAEPRRPIRKAKASVIFASSHRGKRWLRMPTPAMPIC